MDRRKGITEELCVIRQRVMGLSERCGDLSKGKDLRTHCLSTSIRLNRLNSQTISWGMAQSPIRFEGGAAVIGQPSHVADSCDLFIS